MNDLGKQIAIAEGNKPGRGDTCNHCGWCCLTKTCAIAVGLGVSEDTIPCPYLGDPYTCTLVDQFPSLRKDLAIGTGCDSMTQNEILFDIKCK